MNIFKEGRAAPAGLDPAEELELINGFAKTELTEEQVYTFSVVLCDNRVDRDFEKFSDEALEELALLFVGKTGIFDHEWKAENQTARIYRTEVLAPEGERNDEGQPYKTLVGYAYMLRSEKNAELIAEIEAGIKKETSVGCSMGKRICSICGQEHRPPGCGHIPGREYDGKLCYLELRDAKDAYEWSFVAVPAQKGAGVKKSFGEDGEGLTLRGFVHTPEGSGFASEFEALEKEAAFGRECRQALRQEVLRLGLLCDRKLYEALADSSEFMDVKELGALKKVFEERLAEKFPPRSQLPGKDEVTSFDGDVYLV